MPVTSCSCYGHAALSLRHYHTPMSVGGEFHCRKRFRPHLPKRTTYSFAVISVDGGYHCTSTYRLLAFCAICCTLHALNYHRVKQVTSDGIVTIEQAYCFWFMHFSRIKAPHFLKQNFDLCSKKMHLCIIAAVLVLTDCLLVMTVCAARLSCPLWLLLRTQFDCSSGILITWCSTHFTQCYYMYRQFNIQQSHILPTQFISVLLLCGLIMK